jgi:hypothetical protein
LGSIVDIAPPQAASRPLPSAIAPTANADVAARCETLPEPGELWRPYCDRAELGRVCREIVEEHRPEVASAFVDCLARHDPACGVCPRVVCRWEAIEKVKPRHMHACDPIRDAKSEPFAEACDQYASSLSPLGLDRLERCIAETPELGIPCYTESARTPCSPPEDPSFR